MQSTSYFLKNPSNKIKSFFFYLFMGIIGLFIWSKCNDKIKDQDVPDVAYRARAFIPIDTTKPKKQDTQFKTNPVYHKFNLQGSDTSFRFLIFALQRPRDVTQNQLDALLQWVQSVKPDTTK